MKGWRIWISVSGPLCAGMGGKKKKKMMYLTTKNAGKKVCVFIDHFNFKLSKRIDFWPVGEYKYWVFRV